jgi:hypothetical protein
MRNTAKLKDSAARALPATTTNPDELVPDPVVWREFGISIMTGWRWTQDQELGFPPPVKIRNRCFRSRRAIEEFKHRMMRASITQRSRETAA